MIEFDAFISENEAYEKYGRLLVDKELRDARKKSEIPFYNLRKGIFYKEQDLLAYIERKRVEACPAREPLITKPSRNKGELLSIEGSGSAKNQNDLTGSATGTIPTVVESAAERLEQAILVRQRSS